MAVLGECWLRPIIGTNYAEGLVVEGRKLYATAEITASAKGQVATTSVRVTEAKVPRIELQIVPEIYMNYRAKWAENEGRPWLLKIAGRHPSLARYLGPEEEGYPGQHTPLVRALLAEIVAYSVGHRALVDEARGIRKADFDWRGMPSEIAEEVLYEPNQRWSNFLAEAHAVMLSDTEVASPPAHVPSPTAATSRWEAHA